jgi:PBP1b-binding outer membrane lipoprotein LpoB
MKLLNVKTNQIAWSGQKKIKKTVKRSGSGW